jgi:pyridoxal phosphate enzyme (YggS family)
LKTLVQERLAEVLETVKTASNGRENVKLIAVSKTKPVEMIIEAHQAGQILFGENKVQEARDKKPVCPENIEWHLIGPLQKNKAKYCPNIFTTIHTLHRLDVAELLQKKCEETNSQLNVLIQMNLSGEESKSGLQSETELFTFAEQVLEFPRLKLTGLMTISSPQFNEAQTRNVYSQLRELNEKASHQFGIQNQMNELSMGMSNDFEWAIQEGATLVRVGSSIFGSRNYPK